MHAGLDRLPDGATGSDPILEGAIAQLALDKLGGEQPAKAASDRPRAPSPVIAARAAL